MVSLVAAGMGLALLDILSPIPKLGNRPRSRFIGLLRREKSRSSWQLFCSITVTVRC